MDPPAREEGLDKKKTCKTAASCGPYLPPAQTRASAAFIRMLSVPEGSLEWAVAHPACLLAHLMRGERGRVPASRRPEREQRSLNVCQRGRDQKSTRDENVLRFW